MTKLTSDWLYRPETQAVCAALTDAGAQVLFVGGCVRNALMDAPATDIDIATDALPERVMELAENAGLKAIPTGIDHGTITVVSGHIPHEVTTFRHDVRTDGRRAVVAFSADVAEDAARRDFTMNALYATPDGQLIDPLGGLPDLRARRVRFIGSAQDRIREDYLRSLRFFRFHAWYGDGDAGMDENALAAIADNMDGLQGLSKERIGAEFLKLLAAADPAPSVASMRQTGVLQRVLPGADDKALAPLVHVSDSRDPILRLAALGRDFEDPLRLRKADARRARILRDAAENGTPSYLGYSLGAEDACDALALRAALMETPLDSRQLQTARHASDQVFPVSSSDLMPILQGPALGAALGQLETDWIASEFRLTRADLLARFDGNKGG